MYMYICMHCFYVYSIFVKNGNAFRQNLKWPSATHLGELDESCAWNKMLVTHVLPRTLHQMMTSAIEEGICAVDVLKLFPRLSQHSDWAQMMEEFYVLVKDEAVLYSEEDGGRWVKASDALVLDDVTSAYDVVRRVLLESEEESNLVDVDDFVRDQLRAVRGRDIDRVHLNLLNNCCTYI